MPVTIPTAPLVSEIHSLHNVELNEAQQHGFNRIMSAGQASKLSLHHARNFIVILPGSSG